MKIKSLAIHAIDSADTGILASLLSKLLPHLKEVTFVVDDGWAPEAHENHCWPRDMFFHADFRHFSSTGLHDPEPTDYPPLDPEFLAFSKTALLEHMKPDIPAPSFFHCLRDNLENESITLPWGWRKECTAQRIWRRGDDWEGYVSESDESGVSV
jgi:hypothetical protein